ncbi:MAG: hypothetical protein ACXADW_05985 [Candidatus Hodarchaeales archaeon]|jgi:hypothetical protein
MNNEEFLKKVLNGLDPTRSQVKSLLKLRNRIRSCVFKNIGGNPSIFIAGSFKKKTMIKQHYDLDMFLIWSPEFMPLKVLFYEIERALNSNWKIIEQKRVGWRIPYENQFHADVIPAIQDSYEPDYSYLYNCYENTELRTSMQIHMKHIERYNCRDIIKLLKLWKYRRDVPIKTFLLEIMTHLASYNVTSESLSDQLEAVFEYITINIVKKEFYDPANRDNIISADLTHRERYEIRDKANQALKRKNWGQIFENFRKKKK